MSNSHRIGSSALAIAVGAYIYGAVLGGIALGWEWLFRNGVPTWEWWQYLLAPLGIGLVALALEQIGHLIGRGDDVKHPLWKRSVRVLVVLVVMTAVILGPALYRIGHQ